MAERWPTNTNLKSRGNSRVVGPHNIIVVASHNIRVVAPHNSRAVAHKHEFKIQGQ